MNNVKAPIPTSGRIVHYFLPKGTPWEGQRRAAVVTSDFGSLNVNLNVQFDQEKDWTPDCVAHGLTRQADYLGRAWSVPYSDVPKPGHWTWPLLRS